MPKLQESDFYFGAVLATLFKKGEGVNLFLVQQETKSRVYKIMADHTNPDDFFIFAKYRTEHNGSGSWYFNFTENEQAIIREYLCNDGRLSLALVCGASAPSTSCLCILYEDEIRQIFDVGKMSITVSRKKYKRNFYIPIGGGKSIEIPYKRLY